MLKVASIIRIVASGFCKHRYKRERIIYGDEIIFRGHVRSEWYCVKCGRYAYSESAHSIKLGNGW